MDKLGIDQSTMIERTNWPKSSMSDIYSGKKDYNPRLVRAAAEALGIELFELFMHPELALALRDQREAAMKIAQTEPAKLMKHHPSVDAKPERKERRQTS